MTAKAVPPEHQTPRAPPRATLVLCLARTAQVVRHQFWIFVYIFEYKGWMHLPQLFFEEEFYNMRTIDDNPFPIARVVLMDWPHVLERMPH
jgi:hypothetical protein